MTTDEGIQADASFLETAQADAHHVALHRSQVLRLETEELLNECCLDLNHISWAAQQREYLNLLSNLITKIPGSADAITGCPFPLKSDKISSIQLPEGSDLSIVPTGSYALNCLTKRAGNANIVPTLDCAVIVRNSFWAAKDYQNHRYFDKRNLILWHIAKFLSGNKYKKIVGSVQWRYYSGNSNAISLILIPPETQKPREPRKKKVKNVSKNQAKQKFRFQLVMAMQSLDWIQTPRLFPNRSSVKGSANSPYYNAVLARDATWVQAISMLREDINDLPNFGKSLVLTKIWSLQRGFLRGRDSLDEMHIALLLCYIYRTKRATSRMPPLQVFTVLMKFVGSEEFRTSVLVMPSTESNEAHTIAQCEAAKLYEKLLKESPLDPRKDDPGTLVDCYRKCAASSGAILLDSKMLGNYLGSLSPAFCDTLQLQAVKTLTCLNSSRSFNSIFMMNARFWTCLDAYIKIDLNDVDWEKQKTMEKWVDNYPNDLGRFECLSRNIYFLLKQAVGDRVTDIRILTSGNGSNISTPTPELDSDEICTHEINVKSPTEAEVNTLVIGLKINSETCYRAVDRGPPTENVEGVRKFEQLWGDAVELRRFKDGAIVKAVVWNNPPKDSTCVVYEGEERTQGGIVERIVQHVIRVHFLKESCKKKHSFLLKDILTMVDGVHRSDSTCDLSKKMCNATQAHRNILSAFDSLTNFLRKNTEQWDFSGKPKSSRLGLPLSIDAVEPLSASLRYSDPFPAIPHPLLGGAGEGSTGKLALNIPYLPINIQIRFGRSSKWPTDLKSISAAKTAMLVGLADGIEEMKGKGENADFDGPIIVTPSFLTLGYRGYSWKIVVRADPELHFLRSLQKPNEGALHLLQVLTREHIISSSHHSTIHAVHTRHPSASYVVRLMQIWIASHMLSGLIPLEAIELIVAKVYSDTESADAPSVALSGFLQVLHLIATHDWVRYPMIVDPQGNLDEQDKSRIYSQFKEDRGHDMSKGPAMYIVAPYDCIDSNHYDGGDDTEKNSKQNWSKWKLSRPSYTASFPERVIVFRFAALAQRSHSYLLECLVSGSDWTGAFRETQSSLKSYSMLLRVDKTYVVDDLLCSSGEGLIEARKSIGGVGSESVFSRHALAMYEGTKILQRKRVYRNLGTKQKNLVLYDWNPIRDTVDLLRLQLGSRALFFYNEFASQVIAVLWRPTAFKPKVFSAINSELTRPVGDSDWKKDNMGVDNICDIMRELKQVSQDVVVDMKILDKKNLPSQPGLKSKRLLEDIDNCRDEGRESGSESDGST
mmetsp:Transcript_2252/g.3339  ORF Transcript_2252/g.3339 Transcript_2252/m.3339 type:complete len:1276 (+) Transcript_2252:234-4061(+)